MKRPFCLLLLCMAISGGRGRRTRNQRLPYNHPGLVVDLAVGLWAWPIPIDFNGDGKMDLVVVCPCKPYNGTYFFENTSSDPKRPLFKAGVRISKAVANVSPSYVDGQVRVLSPGCEYPDFLKSGLENPVQVTGAEEHSRQQSPANQWRYVDYDGDGKLDLVVGVEDWTDYGWDNAFDSSGKWTTARCTATCICFATRVAARAGL